MTHPSMPPTRKAYFEDCRLGDRLVTPGRTVTETDIVMFASLSGDWNPLHTDAEHARGTAFGQRIGHGLLVLAISSGLFRDGGWSLLPQSLTALTGIEKIRFVAPARIGATIHLESEVVRLREVDATRGLITVHNRVVNESGQEVLRYTCTLLAGRRPAS